ncbi:hypothetical protein Tco_0638341 [Tanacetum coccineum]
MSASQDEIPLIPPPPITPQIAPQQAPYTIEHYLAHTDYPIWEVIQKGNGPRKRKKSKDYLAYGFTRRSPSKVSQYDADAEVTFIDETLNNARNKNNKISNSKVEDDKETALEVKKCLDTSSWSFIFNMFCHNQLKVQFLTTTIGDENHIRTLGDYSKPSHEGYRNTIELPIGNNVISLLMHGLVSRTLTSDKALIHGMTLAPSSSFFMTLVNPCQDKPLTNRGGKA